MSDDLEKIAARYVGAVKAIEGFGLLSDERKLDVLRCVMRYGLVWNHLRSVIPLGHKRREEMTDQEWADFISQSVSFFDAHLRDFGSEDKVVAYIRIHMRWLFPEFQGAQMGVWQDTIAEPEILKVMAWFFTLPDAADYGFQP